MGIAVGAGTDAPATATCCARASSPHVRASHVPGLAEGSTATPGGPPAAAAPSAAAVDARRARERRRVPLPAGARCAGAGMHAHARAWRCRVSERSYDGVRAGTGARASRRDRARGATHIWAASFTAAFCHRSKKSGGPPSPRGARWRTTWPPPPLAPASPHTPAPASVRGASMLRRAAHARRGAGCQTHSDERGYSARAHSLEQTPARARRASARVELRAQGRPLAHL